MRFHNCFLLMLILMTASLPAQASRWYPIETGLRWDYSSASWGTISRIVQAPEIFAGVLSHPLHSDSGSREYFSLDESGRVLQHGVTHSDGSYFVFQPPLLRVDSELTPGHEWETVYDAIQYTVDGVEVQREQARATYSVITVGSVTVAAGTFTAAEVLCTGSTGYLPDYAFRDTYAENLGWILRTDEDGSSVLFELEAYGEGGVRTEVTSWGAVKLKFTN